MLTTGQNVTITANFSCSLDFDIQPMVTDYYIEVLVDNDGHEPLILLARRQPNVTPYSVTDQFTVQVSLLYISRRSSLQLYLADPFGFYTAGADYSVILDNTYPIKAPPFS
jgi:hypothetical protein